MSFNEEKMANIIRAECRPIEEKCEGYEEKLVEVIIEILRAENDNLVKGTYIQQKIDDKCHETGEFLVQGQAKTGKGDI